MEQKIRSDAFSKYFSRIKEESCERSVLLELEKEFHKFCNSLNLQQIRSVQIAFLHKIKPLLFCQITEKDFTNIYSQIFLNTPFPLDSISTLIQFIDCKDNKFSSAKIINIFESIQVELFLKSLLLEKTETIDDCLSIDHFAFILSSYPDRIYNFVGISGYEFASLAISKLEDNLLKVLIQVLSNEKFNIEIFAKIISNYSIEFFDRFLSRVIPEETFHCYLKKIFTFDHIEKRKRDCMIIRLIQFVPDGKTLKNLFGCSPLSDQFLRKCLLEKAIFINSNSSIRNSIKLANLFSLLGQNHLINIFNELVNQFCSQSQILVFVSLQNQFQLSLALIDFARQIKFEIRCSIKDELINSLIHVFPKLLDQSDISRRQIGMFTAQTLFTLFEHNSPKFDYIENDPVFSEFVNALKEEEIHKEDKDKKQSKITDKLQFSSSLTQKRIDSRVAILDSDDDEEEAIPIFIKDENLKQQFLPFAYLQDCLAELKDEKTEYKRWEEALHSIGPMIKKKSIGLNIFGIEILETLLFLEKRFNVPNFMNYKMEIIKLLLVDNPQLISHFVRLFCSKRCSQSHKSLLLSTIVNASKMLYFGDEHEEKRENEKKEKIIINDLTNKEIGKIIWKFSNLIKLENSNKIITSKFAPIASQFVFSLLDLCQKYNFDLEKDYILLSRLILAIGEVINFSKNSPSIVRIASSTFLWLQQFRSQLQKDNLLILNNYIFCYLSLFNSLEISLLKKHFSTELFDIFEWIKFFKEENINEQKIQVNEYLKQTIELFLIKLNEILY